MPAGALPNNVDYGFVTGRFTMIAPDTTSDVDRYPDGVPAQGTVTFTARPGYLLDAGATTPATLVPMPVVCTLDANGDLKDPAGGAGVYLVATSDEDLNPVDWTWGVQIQLVGANPNLIREFSFQLDPGSTVDLTTAIPISSDLGTPITQGPPGPPGSSGASAATVYLDDYPGADDDAKLTNAMVDVASRSNIPGIQLPNRNLVFHTPNRTLFSGLKILGANPGGPMNLELSSGKFVSYKITYDGGGFWWQGPPAGGNTYDVYFANMAIQYSGSSAFLQNPSPGNLYACQWHNMNHYGAAGVFGNSTTKVLMTQNVFSGHWTVLGFTDMAFHVGGSDNSFWESGYLNIDNSQNAPGGNAYMMNFDAIGKSHVGTVYMTCRQGTGWRGVFAEPTHDNPHLTFDSLWIEGTPSLPADGNLFWLKRGTCHIRNLFTGRAMVNPVTASEFGIIQMQDGMMTIDQLTYDRQLTPAGTPVVAVVGGTLRISNAIAVDYETGDVVDVANKGPNAVIYADSSVVVTPDLSWVIARPPILTAMLDLPGAVTDYLDTGPITSYSGGDFDMQCYIAPDDWTTGSSQTLFSSADAGSSQRSVHLYINSTGHLGAVLSTDGSTSTAYDDTLAGGVPGRVDGDWMYCRIKFVRDNGGGNGLLTYFTSTDGVTWTSYNTRTVTGTANLHVSTKKMSIGIRDRKDLPFGGGIGWLQFANSTGAVVARVDFRHKNWTGTDINGNVWHLVGKNSSWRLT